MSRYLDHLMHGTATSTGDRQQQQQQPARERQKRVDVFESLCEVIANDAEQPEISEELRTELRAERGQIVVDDYIRKEVKLSLFDVRALPVNSSRHVSELVTSEHTAKLLA